MSYRDYQSFTHARDTATYSKPYIPPAEYHYHPPGPTPYQTANPGVVKTRGAYTYHRDALNPRTMSAAERQMHPGLLHHFTHGEL